MPGEPWTRNPPPAMRNIPGYITRITPVRFVRIGPWGAKGAK